MAEKRTLQDLKLPGRIVGSYLTRPLTAHDLDVVLSCSVEKALSRLHDLGFDYTVEEGAYTHLISTNDEALCVYDGVRIIQVDFFIEE